VERIRWIAAGFCILLLLQIIRAVRREHIRVEYSMAWFTATLTLLGLSLWDTGLQWLAVALGVEDYPFVLMLVAGLLFLITFFRLTVEVSTLKDHNILLSQKVGMLDWEVRRQQDKIEALHGSHQDNSDSAGPL
jgi:hypothetical protein